MTKRSEADARLRPDVDARLRALRELTVQAARTAQGRTALRRRRRRVLREQAVAVAASDVDHRLRTVSELYRLCVELGQIGARQLGSKAD